MKMILIIDTIDDNCWVAIYGGRRLDKEKWQWKKDTGTEILKNINKLLKRHQLSSKNIRMILVNRGPGSFTGTRVGITVANTLAWDLDIPVIGYLKGELEDSLKNLSKIKQTKFSTTLLPYYK